MGIVACLKSSALNQCVHEASSRNSSGPDTGSTMNLARPNSGEKCGAESRTTILDSRLKVGDAKERDYTASSPRFREFTHSSCQLQSSLLFLNSNLPRGGQLPTYLESDAVALNSIRNDNDRS